MENRRSKKRRSRVSESSNEDVKLSQEISFELFFSKCVQEGKLKAYQHREIAAFFRDMKLRDKENLKVYEDTLGKF